MVQFRLLQVLRHDLIFGFLLLVLLFARCSECLHGSFIVLNGPFVLFALANHLFVLLLLIIQLVVEVRGEAVVRGLPSVLVVVRLELRCCTERR